MRGIILDEVRRVELVTVTHPRVQSFLHWRDQQVQSTLEAKFHERAQEREHLQTLLGAPITALLTEQGLHSQWRYPAVLRDRFFFAPDPTGDRLAL